MQQGIRGVLEDLFASATDERDKGAKFERLMQAYLQTDLQWADRFSAVLKRVVTVSFTTVEIVGSLPLLAIDSTAAKGSR